MRRMFKLQRATITILNICFLLNFWGPYGQAQFERHLNNQMPEHFSNKTM